MATLERASNEWSNRPADQRYSSLAELDHAVQQYRALAKTATVPYNKLTIGTEHGEPVLVGSTGATAQFTNWSFGQLCSRVGAPASFMRELPAPLTAQVLNNRLQTIDLGEDSEANAKLLLAAENGTRIVRAFTSDRYSRIWDADITSRLIRLTERYPVWQPAPAAFDGSRGLYASDHDLFAFMVDNDRRIFEKDKNGGLGRGFFVWNSEVGAMSFGLMTFLYEYCCGNHRVWGAQGIVELRIRHIGNADERAFGELQGELRKYADSSASETEAQIVEARRMQLGATKDEVLDKIFGLRLPQVSRSRAAEAYALADKHSDWYGDPRSVWGFTGGLTQLARDVQYTDDRVALERAAGKVLGMVCQSVALRN